MSSVFPHLAELSGLAIVTVTFHPDLAVLSRQMAALPERAMWIVVDNASSCGEVKALRALLGTRPRCHLLENASNLGLSAALNAGAALAGKLEPCSEFLLLMDQDSEPRGGAVGLLVQGLLSLEQQGKTVGCVGPLLVDDTTGLQHGFHCIDGWRWVRRYPVSGDAPVACANMNGSGTLLRRSLFEALGGLDEAFFIDHIDTDWAFRVSEAGYALYGIPASVFVHRMGDSSFRFWLFGWKVWPHRSPLRHYYLFRNALRLLGRSYVPGVWKGWAVVKLALTFTVYLAFSPQRFMHAKAMLAGVKDGLKRCVLK